MTTEEETTITGGNTMTSSSSPGSEFYFHLAVVVIGVIGTAANALILYALVASKPVSYTHLTLPTILRV